MSTCSRAAVMRSLGAVLAMQSKDLWSLFFRVLPRMLGLLPSLLKKLQNHVHAYPPVRELGTVAGTLPELPQDVLIVIFAKLDVPDLVRAGSVCSCWRSAYMDLCSIGDYKEHQTPCLLYTSESAGDNVACLYSLAEQRAYKLILPEPPIRSRFLIGSSNGWLFTADERSELHLVNPITGQQIALPSVITIEHVKPINDGSCNIHMYELSFYTREKDFDERELYALSDLRDHLYFKAYLFPDPPTGSYIVVLIHNPFYQISFARAGDDKWTWLSSSEQYSDCLYMDGVLYACAACGDIHAFDLTASTLPMTVIIDLQRLYSIETMYIVRAPWGDLLQVRRTVEPPQREDAEIAYLSEVDPSDYDPSVRLSCTLKVTIYKVDTERKELQEIKGLPHHLLFLGHNNTQCLSADEHPELKANHAYFTDDRDELMLFVKHTTHDIGVIDLQNGSWKEIVSQIWSNWPCPVWITPNPTKMNLVFC